MKYYELKISTNLNAPIHFQKAPEAISKLISTALINSGYKKHDSKEVKPYVFSNLGKAQKNGFFEKKGSFYLRSFDKDLISKAANSLMFYKDKIFEIKQLELKEINKRKIEAIKSMNPIFIINKKGDFWTFSKDGDLSEYLALLTNNVIKKYKAIFKEDLKPDNTFIEYFRILNDVPFTFYYKNIKFFGYKLFMHIRDDEISQKLAFIALGAGLGAKSSSVGGGFCRKTTRIDIE